jgi:hypothetical protein
MTRALDKLLNELNTPRKEHPERDYFARPQIPDNPNRSAGWDAKPEWSGASWSGERWSGRNQGGGRER